MSEIETGGPAFPRQHVVADANDPSFKLGHEGMTLRDYFAGQALAGAFTGGDTEIYDDVMARRCYELADAMLKARKEP